jgi:hypothetical protein
MRLAVYGLRPPSHSAVKYRPRPMPEATVTGAVVVWLKFHPVLYCPRRGTLGTARKSAISAASPPLNSRLRRRARDVPSPPRHLVSLSSMPGGMRLPHEITVLSYQFGGGCGETSETDGGLACGASSAGQAADAAGRIGARSECAALTPRAVAYHIGVSLASVPTTTRRPTTCAGHASSRSALGRMGRPGRPGWHRMSRRVRRICAGLAVRLVAQQRVRAAVFEMTVAARHDAARPVAQCFPDRPTEVFCPTPRYQHGARWAPSRRDSC